MNTKGYIFLIFTLVSVGILFELFLFLSGSKILTEELVVERDGAITSQDFIEVFGEYNDAEFSKLACKYFNGRKFVYREYKFSLKNEGGIDACPAFLRPRQ